MPPKRPAPLSDEVFAAAAANAKSGTTYLGATYNGMPLPVKNTFIDVPSGFTPMNMKTDGRSQIVMTAPADLSQAPGYLQRAMVASIAQPVMTPSVAASPMSLRVNRTPLMTPSPTSGGAAFHNWVVASASRPFASPTARLQSSPKSIYTVAPAQYVTRPQALELVVDGEDDEENDDDSDDGIVPPHLRNMENAPKPPPGALHPSLGSEAHAASNCKRCCFFPRGRCTNGYNCEFCHYDHEKRKRKNKRKKKKESGTTTSTTTTVVMQHISGDGRHVLHMPQVHSAAPMLTAMPPGHFTQVSPPAPMQINWPPVPMTTAMAPMTSAAPVTMAAPEMPYQAVYYPDRRPQMIVPQPFEIPHAVPGHTMPAPGHIIYGPTQVPGSLGAPGFSVVGADGSPSRSQVPVPPPLGTFLAPPPPAYQPAPQQLQQLPQHLQHPPLQQFQPPPQQMVPQHMMHQQLPQQMPQQMPEAMMQHQMPPQPAPMQQMHLQHMQQLPPHLHAMPNQQAQYISQPMPAQPGPLPPSQPPQVLHSVEPTPPPPMLSPNLRQMVPGPLLPPPVSSPKMTRMGPGPGVLYDSAVSSEATHMSFTSFVHVNRAAE